MTSELKFVDAAEFARRAQEHTADGLLIRQNFHTEIKEVDGNMTLQFAISSRALDRDGDTIDPNGWKMDNYRKNPVVLWAHDYGEPPVARSVKEWVEDEKLKSRAEFTPKELYPFGFMIFQMLKGGFLNTTSVGFKPEEWSFAEGADRKFGIDYKKQELLEYSIVPVPSNPAALIEARSVGIDTAPMLAWAEKILDLGEGGIWLPKKSVEDIYSLLKPDKTIIDLGQGRAKKEDGLMDFFEEKRGRVLNAANEKKLRDARTLISDVLESVSEGQDEDNDDKAVDTLGQIKELLSSLSIKAEDPAFDVGDWVRPTNPHMPEHDTPMQIVSVQTGIFYEVLLPGEMVEDEPHRWYAQFELEATEEPQDLEERGNTPAPDKDAEPVFEFLDEPTLELKDEDESEETIEAGTLQDMVREIIRNELRELKMRLTGRVD